MASTRSAIEEARAEGYSDQEIADYLVKISDEAVNTARDEGYSDSEIVDYLLTRQSLGPTFSETGARGRLAPMPITPDDMLGPQLAEPGPRGRVSAPSPRMAPQDDVSRLYARGGPFGPYIPDPTNKVEYGPTMGESLSASVGEDFTFPKAADWWSSLRGTLARQLQGYELDQLESLEDEILGRAWPVNNYGDPTYSRSPEELRRLQSDPLLIAVREKIAEAKAAGMEITAEQQDIAQRYPEYWPKVVMGATNSFAASAPALATTMVTRNPALGASMMYGPTALSEYGEMREDLVPRGLADKASTVSGLIEAGAELPALSPFAREASPILRRFGETIAADVPGETVAGLGQSVVSKVARADPNAPLLDPVAAGLKEGLEELPVTYGTTFLTAGAHAGMGHVIDMARQKAEQARREADAAQAEEVRRFTDAFSAAQGEYAKAKTEATVNPKLPFTLTPPQPADLAQIMQQMGAPPAERQEPYIGKDISSVVPHDPYAPELPLPDPNIQPELPLATMPPPASTGSRDSEQAGGGITAPTPPAAQGTATPPLSSAFGSPVTAAPPATPAPQAPAPATAPQQVPAVSPTQEPAGGAAASPVFSVMDPNVSGPQFGAKIGDHMAGTTRHLLIDTDGSYFWGDRSDGMNADLTGPATWGEHAGYERAMFKTAKEAKAAGAATPQTKRAPSGKADTRAPHQMTRKEFEDDAAYQGVNQMTDDSKPTYWWTDQATDARMWAQGHRGSADTPQVKKTEPRIDIASKGELGAEWKDADNGRGSKHAYTGGPEKKRPVRASIPLSAADDPHRYLVEKALAEGKTVPPEVLADYPDLAKKYAGAKPPSPQADMFAEKPAPAAPAPTKAAEKPAHGFERPAAPTSVNMGGPGGLMPVRPLSLTVKSPELYHETSLKDVRELVLDDTRTGPVHIYVTDDPALAIGQGGKGITLTYRTDGLSGRENKKPGTGIVGGREYIAEGAAKNSILKIHFKDGKTWDKAGALTKDVLRGPFTETRNPDGSVTLTRKGIPAEPAQAEASPSLAKERATLEDFIKSPPKRMAGEHKGVDKQAAKEVKEARALLTKLEELEALWAQLAPEDVLHAQALRDKIAAARTDMYALGFADLHVDDEIARAKAILDAKPRPTGTTHPTLTPSQEVKADLADKYDRDADEAAKDGELDLAENLHRYADEVRTGAGIPAKHAKTAPPAKETKKEPKAKEPSPQVGMFDTAGEPTAEADTTPAAEPADTGYTPDKFRELQQSDPEFKLISSSQRAHWESAEEMWQGWQDAKADKPMSEERRANMDQTPYYLVGYAKGLGMNPPHILALKSDVANWLHLAEREQARGKPKPAPTTAEFKEWFGDSKIVNEDGTPQVNYHGTYINDLREFRQPNRWLGEDVVKPTGVHFFTPDRPVAASFAAQRQKLAGKGKQSVYAVYLRVENPIDLRNMENIRKVLKAAGMAGPPNMEVWMAHALLETPGTLRAIKKMGHDGALIVEEGKFFGRAEHVPAVVVFDPKQIKSVRNKGTFRKDTDLIHEALGEDADEEATATEASSRTRRADERIITPSTVRENLMNHLGIDAAEFRNSGGKKQWDIVTAAIKDKYGFANIEIADRQNWRPAVDHLLDAFESLQNMAQAMGQGNKIVSLNGKGSLYLREKTRGKTQAYYRHKGALSGEHDYNIAIFNRADFYSHEFAHFLDYDLMERSGGFEPGGLTRMLRNKEPTAALPGTTKEAFANLLTALYFDAGEIALLIKKVEHQLQKAKTPKRQAELQRRLDNLKSGAWRGRGSKTEFYKRAQNGPMAEYLTKPTELFARAFEAYMSWKIQEQHAMGLVKFIGATDSIYRDTADAWIARTYPQAVDRQNIFSSFDNLLGQLARENIYKVTAATPGYANSQLNLGLMDPVAQAKASGLPITPEIVRAKNLTNAAAETYIKDEAARNDRFFKNLARLGSDVAKGLPGAPDAFRAFMKSWSGTPDSLFAFLERRFPDIPALRTIRDNFSDAQIHGRDKPVGLYRQIQQKENSLTNRIEDKMLAVGVIRNMDADEAEHLWDVMTGNAKPKDEAVKRQADQMRHELDYMWGVRDQTGESIGYIDEPYQSRVFQQRIADSGRFHADILKLRHAEKAALVKTLTQQLAQAAKDSPEAIALAGRLQAAKNLDPAAATVSQVAAMKGLKWGTPIHLGALSADSAKERVFGPLADVMLKDWYVKDPMTLLAGYASSAARGIVMRQRLGPNPEQAIQALLDATALKLPSVYADVLKNAMEVSLGTRTGQHGIISRAMNAYANVNNAHMLGRSVLPNISEILNVMSKSNNPLSDFGKLMKAMIPLMRSQSRKECYEIADRFGRLSGTLVDAASSTTAMAQAIGEDVAGNGLLARFSMRAFYFNLLSGLTAWQEKVTNRVGLEIFYETARMVRAGGKDAGLYKQWLREHGIRDADAFAAFLQDHKTVDSVQFEDTLLPGVGQTLANALDHFVHTTIQKPTPSTKLIQAHNGAIGVMFRLTSWMTTNFTNWAVHLKDKAMTGISGRYGGDILTIPQRFKSNYKGQKLTIPQRIHGRVGGTQITPYQRLHAMAYPVAASLVTMYMAQALFVVARMMLTNSDEWENRGEDFWDRFFSRKTQLQILQYWGVLGWLSNTAIDVTEGTRHNRGAVGTLLGPSYGGMAQDAERFIKYFTDNSPNTNTAENNAAQATWHITSLLATIGIINSLPITGQYAGPVGRVAGFLWSFFGTSPQATREFADVVTGEKPAALKKRADAGDSEARRELQQRERENTRREAETEKANRGKRD